MPLNLKSVANGSVILDPASTVTDKTITIPATDGTMVVQDGTNTTTLTNVSYSGTLTGGTGVVNIGSGQVYKDASGNVGVGTVSPSSKLHINGETRIDDVGSGYSILRYLSSGVQKATSYWNNGANAFASEINGSGIFYWSANGSERMRIDSSGNLLVGTTGDAGRLRIRTENTSSGTWGCQMLNSAGTIMFAFLNSGNFYTGNGAGSPYNNTTGASANLVVGSDQGILQRSTSSLRYKTDVQDATHGLADVMTLRPVTYKGKNDGDTVFGGLIAEEVDAAGLNEFVVYDSEGRPDALHYGNMVSLAFKAIQELKAEFDAYKLSHP